MFRKHITTVSLTASAVLLSVANAANAQGLLSDVSAGCRDSGNCQIKDFFIVGNSVVKLILGLSGSFMLLMVIVGGFFWLTSAGNAERIERGKKILSGAVIGLIIVFVSYTVIQFILAAVGVPNVAELFKRPFGGK